MRLVLIDFACSGPFYFKNPLAAYDIDVVRAFDDVPCSRVLKTLQLLRNHLIPLGPVVSRLRLFDC